MTVGRLMVLTLYIAVALAIVAPVARNVETSGIVVASVGWLVVVVFGAVTVPLAWSVLTLLVIRPGPLRDRWILLCLTVTFSSMLGVGLFLTGVRAYMRLVDPSVAPSSTGETLELLKSVLAFLLMGFGLVFLGRRIVARRRRVGAQPRPPLPLGEGGGAAAG
jgi:hypothetical protein